jgi:hypothetical protein
MGGRKGTGAMGEDSFCSLLISMGDEGEWGGEGDVENPTLASL